MAATIMASAGSFAAISTLFGSPVLAAFLIMETAGIGGATLSLVALPGLLASGIGALVFVGLDSWTGLGSFSLALTTVPPAVDPTVATMAWAVVVGAIGALLGWVIRRIGLSLRPVVHLNRVLVTAGLGLLVGLTATVYQLVSGNSFTQVLFSGQDALPALVEHAADYSVGVLILLIVCKMLAYGLSLSAFRGGPVFPSMFIGAVLGIAMSGLPGMSLAPAIAMGIGAMCTAMLRLPLTSTLLATLLLGADGVSVTPQVVVAVVVAYVLTNVLPAPGPSGRRVRRRPRAGAAADGDGTASLRRRVAQSFFMLTTVQPSRGGLLQRLLGAGGVGELALGVVVEHEQAQRRRSSRLGELEHRDVAVGVAGGEQRPAADAAPDAHRLLAGRRRGSRPRRLCVMVPPCSSAGVGEGGGAADHPFARDAVDLLADRPHEVAAASRGDVVGEPVVLQVARAARPSARRRTRGTGGRASGAARCAGTRRPGLEVLDAHPRVGGQDAAEQRPHVGVVAGVVLGDDRAEPAVVALVGRLPGLAVAQGRVGLGHLDQPAQDEVEPGSAAASRTTTCRRCRTPRPAPRPARRRRPSARRSPRSPPGGASCQLANISAAPSVVRPLVLHQHHPAGCRPASRTADEPGQRRAGGRSGRPSPR